MDLECAQFIIKLFSLEFNCNVVILDSLFVNIFNKHDCVGLSIANKRNDLVKYFTSLSPNLELGNFLYIAAFSNNTEILDLIIEKEKGSLARGLFGAIDAQNDELINYFVDNGRINNINEFGNALQIASAIGNKKWVEYFLNKIKHPNQNINIHHFIYSLNNAIEKGHLDIIQIIWSEINKVKPFYCIE